MKTIHVILNAHLDPIWLWPWQAGLDEAIATCRSACDRLDQNPDIIFSRGEAWVYDQFERVDPKLFDRIRQHIEAKRWEIVGGWWIQPDCNLPSEWAMRWQIRLGKEYFEKKFGVFPRYGYNVDSFGHAAGLPKLMTDAGQDSYIMMRPGPSEMALPASIFRWRGYSDGPEVLTARIHGYQTNTEVSLDYVHRCVSGVPAGIDHALCFVGIGDHGGGPTQQQIEWCRQHAGVVPGWQMQFSSPGRFFDAVRADIDKLPVVTGELQPHAVGCYSVIRSVKTAVRRAEHLLAQAEVVARAEDAPAIAEAWKRVCFNHFHDTFGGTSIPSAYPIVLDQIGAASMVADEILQHGLRRRMNELPDNELQRVVLYNASSAPYAGYVEFEPWVDWWQPWLPDCVLLDSSGNRVPFQVIESEAFARFGTNGGFTRLLFHSSLGPNELNALRIQRNCGDVTFQPSVFAAEGKISNDAGIAVSRDGPQAMDGAAWPTFELHLNDDRSDTWSHGVIGFSDEIVSKASWTEPVIVDSGPIMASLVADGTIGDSELRSEWRVYAGEPYAEWILNVNFREKHKMLKLAIRSNGGFEEDRIDGVMGGALVRPNSGAERPLRDWTLIRQLSGPSLGIVAPDVYGIDGSPDRVRLTLLRSPAMAHHEPVDIASAIRAVIADRGTHTFRFRYYCGNEITEQTLEPSAFSMQRPPVIADLTRGMPLEFRSNVNRSV